MLTHTTSPAGARTQFTIIVDAAPNVVTRVVNRFGKKMKFDNGGYRVGCVVKNAEGVKTHEATFINSICPDQFAAEAFAVLKAIELSDDFGCTHLTVVSDRIESFTDSTKKGYKGASYLWLAKKLADEKEIEVEFERVAGVDNEADGLSRSEQHGLVDVAERAAAEAVAKAARVKAELERQLEVLAKFKADSEARRLEEEQRTEALADPATAKHGVESLAAALERHPNALRLTRKGCLVGEQDVYVANIAAEINWPLGCCAWLSQNGHAATVDNRTLYFACAKTMNMQPA